MFVVVDNGSDHRGKKAAGRLGKAHPNTVMIHTPVHASWLNQVEIFFSVIQKKVVSPNDSPSLGKLSETLLAFTGRYNPDRQAVQLEIHRQRPQGPAPPHHRTRETPRHTATRARSSRLTPDELTVSPTK